MCRENYQRNADIREGKKKKKKTELNGRWSNNKKALLWITLQD